MSSVEEVLKDLNQQLLRDDLSRLKRASLESRLEQCQSELAKRNDQRRG